MDSKSKTLVICGIVGLMILAGGIIIYINKRKQQAPIQAKAKKEEAFDYLTSQSDIIAQEED